jgi:radical SAM-linked protein
VFRRAFSRAGIGVRHSQGYNPHPKMALPLPRSVGVESDEELLCVELVTQAPFDDEAFKAALSKQLPPGFGLLSVEPTPPSTSFEPLLAEYVLQLLPDYATAELQSTARRLMAADRIEIERADSSGRARRIDVRCFLEKIEMAGGTDSIPTESCQHPRVITIQCRIAAAGSIRVNEILQLLGLQTHMLAGAIRRTRVQWRRK